MKGIIMAGGEGTRLRPLTCDCPKPMIRLMDRPLMAYALRLLKHYHFDNYTDIMYGGDNDGTLKKRDIIQKCIDTIGVKDLGEVVMVGDTLHDSNGAKELGVDFIGVSYGFGFHGDDAKGIENMAATPKEVLKFI